MLSIDKESPTKRMTQSTDIKEMESEECVTSALGGCPHGYPTALAG